MAMVEKKRDQQQPGSVKHARINDMEWRWQRSSSLSLGDKSSDGLSRGGQGVMIGKIDTSNTSWLWEELRYLDCALSASYSSLISGAKVFHLVPASYIMNTLKRNLLSGIYPARFPKQDTV